MLLPKSCPICRVGDLAVERGESGATATCQLCGHTADPETMRREMTLRALQDTRERNPTKLR